MTESNKKTLRSMLSKDSLREMAGDKIYERGANYYGQNLVDLLFHEPYEAAAEVRGTHPYRVDFSVSDEGEIEADCTCPAMNSWGFCKHCVATGLLLIDTPAAKKGSEKPRKQETDLFAKAYPNLANWIHDGTIEIGRDGCSTSMIRIIDEGGVVFEGGTRHKSIDKMLEEAEEAAKEWLGEE